MSKQTGDTSAAMTGQQGPVYSGKEREGPKQAKAPGLKQSKGKGQSAGRQQQAGNRRAPRTAEIGTTGRGFVKLVKENFGFVSSPDLDDQLFFHASEVLPPEGHEGTPPPFKDAIAAGDEVEFIVGQNTGKRSNFVAKQVKKLPQNSVKAELLSEERYLGTVIQELNSGQWRSEDSSNGRISYQEPASDGKPGKAATLNFSASDNQRLRRQLLKGMLVEFNICTDNQTQERRAVNISVKVNPRQGHPDAQNGGRGQPVEPTVLHGFIKSIKPQSGVIRCVETDERFTFRKSDVPAQHLEKLQVGAEVMFNMVADAQGSSSVISLAVLLPGSLPTERVSPDLIEGRVARPLGPPGAAEDGLIVTSGETDDQRSVPFRAGPLEGGKEDAASLGVDDEVEFTLVTDFRTDRRHVRDLKLVCRAADKRELGQVRTLKGNFGFIRCCQRSNDLFFHFTTLQNCQPSQLQKGDDVEFTVVRDPEHGTIAVRVQKMPPGSAVFETVSEEEYSGVVLSSVLQISPVASSNGVVSFQEDGAPAKLLFGTSDFKDKVSAGDHVTFRIANNINAARQAEKLGAVVSRLVGRRATQGSLLKVSGTVRQSNGGYGFIRYTAKGGSAERSVFFHSSEVAGNLALKVGDEVTFGLADNPKTKELNAKRIVRTKEAPTQEVKEPAASRNPQAMKFTGGGSPAGNQSTVRMAAMPDGTRGFHVGRGGALKPPTPSAGALTSTSNQAPGAMDIPSRMPAAKKSSGYGSHSRSLPSLHRLSIDSRENGTAGPPANDASLLSRSASGKSLNPAAPTFMPKTLSATALASEAAAAKES